jgi:hypothetical protein
VPAMLAVPPTPALTDGQLTPPLPTPVAPFEPEVTPTPVASEATAVIPELSVAAPIEPIYSRTAEVSASIEPVYGRTGEASAPIEPVYSRTTEGPATVDKPPARQRPSLASMTAPVAKIGNDVVLKFREFVLQTRRAYARLNLGNRILRARDLAKAGLTQHRTTPPQEPPAVPDAPIATPTVNRWPAINKTWVAAIATARRACAGGLNLAGEYGRGAQQLWNRRVRVKVTAGAQLRSALIRFSQARSRVSGRFRQNERLVMPLMMAVLSAMLTLGLIAVVGRYQPSVNARDNNAATKPAPNLKPTVAPAVTPLTASVAEVSKPSPARQHAVNSSVVKSSLVRPATLAKPGKVKESKPQPRKARRSSADDDYVARDTYVYYGK